MRGGGRLSVVLLIMFLVQPLAAGAQMTEEDDQNEFFAQEKGLFDDLRISGHVSMGYRWSEDHLVVINTPLPFDATMRTVDPGSTFEVSNVRLQLDWGITEAASAHVAIDIIDLYNRNPTSTDDIVDVDEVWIQLGRNYGPAELAPGTTFYGLVGKAPKFEKQLKRSFESYGLVGTAMNRMGDLQLQLGGTLGSHVYWKAQASNGNPLFMRDPGLLAGDQGPGTEQDPVPEGSLWNGFPILYDAEVEWTSRSEGSTEYGAGLGMRFVSSEGDASLDVLAFGYTRELADRVALNGTFYGGDLDILSAGELAIPTDGREKTEAGLNIDGRWRGIEVFGQYVDQDIAGLARRGLEVELVWRFDLAPRIAWRGKQLFTFIQPAVRYSSLDNDFAGPAGFPAPSFWWDWEKTDIGLRIGLVRGLDMTLEYSRQDIAAKKPFTVDEALLNLHYAF